MREVCAMRIAAGLTFAVAILAPAFCSESSDVPPRLTSLHGTMVVMLNEEEGMPFEIWAKGDYFRSEHEEDSQKIVSIQYERRLNLAAPGAEIVQRGWCSGMLPGLPASA